MSGEITISRKLVNGKTILIEEKRIPYDIIGETSIFSEYNTPYDIQAVATKKSHVMAFQNNFLFSTSPCHSSCDTCRKIFQNLLNIMATQNSNLTEKNLVLLNGTLKRKIALYLCLNYENNQTHAVLLPTRKEMAKDLGVSRPSLSRVLIEMHSDGLISISGQECKISDIKKTEDLI